MVDSVKVYSPPQPPIEHIDEKPTEPVKEQLKTTTMPLEEETKSAIFFNTHKKKIVITGIVLIVVFVLAIYIKSKKK